MYDWLPFELRLRRNWTHIRNRSECIDADASGVRCEWRWTSDLHIAAVFPSAGLRLMRAAFAQWPIGFAAAVPETDAPRVSFIIGHRGLGRLPHLLATIGSIAAQHGTPVECIVVEQSAAPETRPHLPPGIRYVHTPVEASRPYCRSCAFNAGARQARGEVLVLHDNDIVVPALYATAALETIAAGADFANLIRFLFHLREVKVTLDAPPERVVQNTQGGSIVARRDAYFDIGGYDEDFVGWGGEDNDFWDRASTRRVQSHAFVPMLHLPHPPQAGKELGERAPAVARYRELERVPAAERIARLREKQRFP